MDTTLAGRSYEAILEFSYGPPPEEIRIWGPCPGTLTFSLEALIIFKQLFQFL